MPPTPFSKGEFETPPADDPNKDVPDEFKSMSKADLARMVKERDETVKGLGGRVTQVLEEVTKLREGQERTKPPVTPTETPDPYAKPGEYVDHKLAEFQARKIEPLVAAYMSKAETDAMTYVLSKPHMKDYRADVEKVIKGAQPQAKVHPDFPEEVYKYVRGVHFEEIVEKAKKEREAAPEFTEVSTSAGPRRANSAPETLSSEEKRVAENMGMPEDKYIAWKNKGDELGSEMVASKARKA